MRETVRRGNEEGPPWPFRWERCEATMLCSFSGVARHAGEAKASWGGGRAWGSRYSCVARLNEREEAGGLDHGKGKEGPTWGRGLGQAQRS